MHIYTCIPGCTHNACWTWRCLKSCAWRDCYKCQNVSKNGALLPGLAVWNVLAAESGYTKRVLLHRVSRGRAFRLPWKVGPSSCNCCASKKSKPRQALKVPFHKALDAKWQHFHCHSACQRFERNTRLVQDLCTWNGATLVFKELNTLLIFYRETKLARLFSTADLRKCFHRLSCAFVPKGQDFWSRCLLPSQTILLCEAPWHRLPSVSITYNRPS